MATVYILNISDGVIDCFDSYNNRDFVNDRIDTTRDEAIEYVNGAIEDGDVDEQDIETFIDMFPTYYEVCEFENGFSSVVREGELWGMHIFHELMDKLKREVSK